MFGYPLQCAPASTAGVHFSGHLNDRWWQNHALTSLLHCLWLVGLSVASEYTSAGNRCYVSFGDGCCPRHAKDLPSTVYGSRSTTLLAIHLWLEIVFSLLSLVFTRFIYMKLMPLGHTGKIGPYGNIWDYRELKIKLLHVIEIYTDTDRLKFWCFQVLPSNRYGYFH